MLNDVFHYISEYFKSQDATTFFINLTIGVVLLSIIMLILHTLASIVRKVVSKIRYHFATIEIVDEFVAASKKHKMAVSLEDVETYLKKVKNMRRKEVYGIKQVILCERNSFTTPTAVASYQADDAIINLFPLQYNESKDLYLIPITQSTFIGVDEKTAKEFQLFCIGHEIGHHVAFKETGILHGAEVERFCDRYSEELGIVRNHEKDFRPEDLIVLPAHKTF